MVFEGVASTLKELVPNISSGYALLLIGVISVFLNAVADNYLKEKTRHKNWLEK